MAFDPEIVYRGMLALLLVGLVTIGIPHRLRAERAGGNVSRRVDPRWFWIGMSIGAPAVPLACLAFLLNPRWVDFAAIGAPAWLRLLGVPMAGLGLGLFGWMFRHLGLNVTSTSMPRATATLVTSGPYRWVRHPMYSAAFILLVATTLLTANAVVAAGGTVAFGLLVARSRVEEERLVARFGAAYREYQHTTGTILPPVRPVLPVGTSAVTFRQSRAEPPLDVMSARRADVGGRRLDSAPGPRQRRAHAGSFTRLAVRGVRCVSLVQGRGGAHRSLCAGALRADGRRTAVRAGRR